MKLDEEAVKKVMKLSQELGDVLSAKMRTENIHPGIAFAAQLRVLSAFIISSGIPPVIGQMLVLEGIKIGTEEMSKVPLDALDAFLNIEPQGGVS